LPHAEQDAADDLGNHHNAAQANHQPCPALVSRMAFAEENVVVRL
jgi:hypothetical protein